MKKRSILLIAALAGLSILFMAAGIYAGTQPKDKFGIETQGCENTKGVVDFDHKKHSEEYAKKFAEFYPNGCGECHHDDKGKPIKDLKAGMEVKKCFECHDKCGEKPKTPPNCPRPKRSSTSLKPITKIAATATKITTRK